MSRKKATVLDMLFDGLHADGADFGKLQLERNGEHYTIWRAYGPTGMLFCGSGDSLEDAIKDAFVYRLSSNGKPE